MCADLMSYVKFMGVKKYQLWGIAITVYQAAQSLDQTMPNVALKWD